jgi:hypothetical protein
VFCYGFRRLGLVSSPVADGAWVEPLRATDCPSGTGSHKRSQGGQPASPVSGYPKRLNALGRTMHDPGGADPGDTNIPAIYTYFGQFVDHDITLEASSFTTAKLLSPSMVPLPLDTIRDELKNLRTATLELDSLYGPPAPCDPANRSRMLLGRVTPLHGTEIPALRPRGKGDDNDLPREPRSGDIRHDRAARIGDPSNDENLIVGQRHLAFLKAHNRLIGQARTFAQARRLLRQHYQHIVIHDFLRRVADPKVVDRILEHGNRVYDALAEPFFCRWSSRWPPTGSATR